MGAFDIFNLGLMYQHMLFFSMLGNSCTHVLSVITIGSPCRLMYCSLTCSGDRASLCRFKTFHRCI